MPILLLALGIAAIITGGDLFVSSSLAIARRAGVSRAMIGGTLVSLATTAPELAVSVTASLRGNPGLAIGNAVGSAICNIGLIVGALCILHPLDVRRDDFTFPARTMLAAGMLLTALTVSLRLGRFDGLVLSLCAVAYLAIDYRRHRNRAGGSLPAQDPGGGEPFWTRGRAFGRFGVGAVLVVGGSRLLADNAVRLAEMAGVPPMIIGLTVVAIGTSLPELVTAVTAARKGVPELSLGNVVGANILNVTLIPGVSSIIHPLQMTRRTQVYNLPAMLAVFVLLLVMARTGRKLTRGEGWILILFYVGYLAGLVWVGWT